MDKQAHYLAGVEDAQSLYGIKLASPASDQFLIQNGLSGALYAGFGAYNAPEGQNRLVHGAASAAGGVSGGIAGEYIGGEIAARIGAKLGLPYRLGKLLGGMAGGITGGTYGYRGAKKLLAEHYASKENS